MVLYIRLYLRLLRGWKVRLPKGCRSGDYNRRVTFSCSLQVGIAWHRDVLKCSCDLGSGTLHSVGVRYGAVAMARTDFACGFERNVLRSPQVTSRVPMSSSLARDVANSEATFVT